jgi:4-alpha-glucanotransferase
MKFPFPGRRLLGVAVPLSALWTDESLGIGEFADLPGFGRWCRDCGIELVQILPVNDSGDHASPYFALSAFALHPIHVRLSDLPEAPSIGKEIAAAANTFPPGARIIYRDLLSSKMAALKAAFERNAQQIAVSAPLRDWIEANAWIKTYAPFRVLKDRNSSRGWKDWAGMRDPRPKDIAGLWKDPEYKRDLYFYAWLQFRLEEQFRRAVEALEGMGVALKGDLPILLNEDSADVWADRSIFLTDFTAGSPPDAGTALGQNWGFPIYDRERLAGRGYDFWVDRLKQADKFYHAYRIDHVLGFFRVWAVPERDRSAALGRFIPYESIPAAVLLASGFDAGRIRWLSEPHIRLSAMYERLYGAPDLEGEIKRVIDSALVRVGSEDLFLFNPRIRGEKDIWALDIEGRSKDFLIDWWRNRALLSTGDGFYLPTWRYWETQAFSTLSAGEKASLEALFHKAQEKSELEWESGGREILGVLRKSSGMLPCAEDLGAIPPAVPKVLSELGILGLRIARWTRKWKEPGEPFIPLGEYPEASVSTLSVHDTSTLREWWERESDHRDFYRAIGGGGDCPQSCDPGTAAFVLKKAAAGSSRLFIPALQDLLALTDAFKPADCREERVNVPGSDDAKNWSYRMPCRIGDLAADHKLRDAVRAVASARKTGEAS